MFVNVKVTRCWIDCGPFRVVVRQCGRHRSVHRSYFRASSSRCARWTDVPVHHRWSIFEAQTRRQILLRLSRSSWIVYWRYTLDFLKTVNLYLTLFNYQINWMKSARSASPDWFVIRVSSIPHSLWCSKWTLSCKLARWLYQISFEFITLSKSDRNPIVECDSPAIPHMNLLPWKDSYEHEPYKKPYSPPTFKKY